MFVETLLVPLLVQLEEVFRQRKLTVITQNVGVGENSGPPNRVDSIARGRKFWTDRIVMRSASDRRHHGEHALVRIPRINARLPVNGRHHRVKTPQDCHCSDNTQHLNPLGS
jgi:hypothetical protein